MTIKQYGGVFGRNPTFNDVTIEGQLTFDGDIDVNSDLKVTGDVEASKFIATTSGYTVNPDKPIFGLFGTAGFVQAPVGGEVQIWADSTSSIATFKDNMDVSINTGNLVIGTSGKGIDFSATAGTGTSELLDDYEEGTFTPEIADASSGGNTGSAALAEGYYTKVGRLVTIAIALINIDTTGMTAGNNLHVRNLPFSQGAGVDHGSARVNAVTFSGSLSTYCTGTYALVADSVSGASFGYVTVGDCTSGSADIYMSFTYRV